MSLDPMEPFPQAVVLLQITGRLCVHLVPYVDAVRNVLQRVHTRRTRLENRLQNEWACYMKNVIPNY